MYVGICYVVCDVVGLFNVGVCGMLVKCFEVIYEVVYCVFRFKKIIFNKCMMLVIG